MCRTTVCIVLVVSLCQLAACGSSGDSSSTTQPPSPKVDPTKPAAINIVSGDGQTARIKSTVTQSAAVRVTNGSGTPLPNVLVSFTVISGGGSLAASSALTGGDGSATVPAWTLGSAAGTNAVSATVAGLAPVDISATARLPYWTVMIYMAADNTLAGEGVVNLAQMSSAGVNPEVQVVVQAEFSPTYLAQYGCSPACYGRTNYNTFRYVMDGSQSAGVLRGPTTDLGNLNMADPGTLRSFVQWGAQTAPSQRTLLVLWNHGGAQMGLIEDETSAPNGVPMTLPQLASALVGLPPVDILDFQMCLMGGYEPLSAMRALTTTIIASEETETVGGWDFAGLLRTFYTNPTAATTTLTMSLADVADAAYATLPYTSTVAAYNMSGFANVDAAVTQLGNALSAIAPSSIGAISSAAANAQGFEYPWLRDLVDFSDSLRAHTNDAGVLAAATNVRAAVTSPTFLLANHTRSGNSYNTRAVNRARGLQFVMPANAASGLPSTGPGSFSSYQQAFPATAWGSFLQKWISLSSPVRSFTDIGPNPLTTWVVWDTVFAKRGVIEMLVLEPDGSLYGPAFGTVSPSGIFSADARATQAYYEGWMANRFVETGTFQFIAWLVSDPSNYEPLVNVAYQIGTGPVTSLFGTGTYPRLSFAHSFLTDPLATSSRLLANAYTDFQVVARWGPIGSSDVASLSRGSDGAAQTLANAPTAAQIETLRQLAPTILRRDLETPVGDPGAMRQRIEGVLRQYKLIPF
jgi:hypothetical protein